MQREDATEELIQSLAERASDPARATYMRERCPDAFRGDEFTPARLHTVPLAPVLTEDQVATSERQLGFRLPQFLRKVYLNVGNGGFGPGYGLYGLNAATGDYSDSYDYALDHYRVLVQGPHDYPRVYRWPLGMLPVCHWGCGIFSFINCAREDGRVHRYSFEGYDPEDPKSCEDVTIDALPVESGSVREWLQSWIDGRSDS
jgi:SMI1 / KNR4 family (SUKH-1)